MYHEIPQGNFTISIVQSYKSPHEFPNPHSTKVPRGSSGGGDAIRHGAWVVMFHGLHPENMMI